jgi:hypothetical protein
MSPTMASTFCLVQRKLISEHRNLNPTKKSSVGHDDCTQACSSGPKVTNKFQPDKKTRRWCCQGARPRRIFQKLAHETSIAIAINIGRRNTQLANIGAQHIRNQQAQNGTAATPLPFPRRSDHGSSESSSKAVFLNPHQVGTSLRAFLYYPCQSAPASRLGRGASPH